MAKPVVHVWMAKLPVAQIRIILVKSKPVRMVSGGQRKHAATIIRVKAQQHVESVRMARPPVLKIAVVKVLLKPVQKVHGERHNPVVIVIPVTAIIQIVANVRMARPRVQIPTR